MTDTDLTPSEARAVIRRYIHDWRNLINSMELEIACLLDDPAAHACGPPLQKVHDQLALAERGLRSLSVRFVEPARDIAAATDLFHNWRQQIARLTAAPSIRWEDPVCDAAITVDFSAVASVLCEICLEAKPAADAPPLAAGITGHPDEVVFCVREPASWNSHGDTPPEAQQWAEWERLIKISGGRLERSYDLPGAHSVTCVRFPVAV